MAIEFHCPGCGKLMRTPDETAGRKGRCPHCAVKVRIPDESIASSGSVPLLQPVQPEESTSRTSPTSKWKFAGSQAATPKPQEVGTIEFTCSACRNRVKVSAAAAGKQGQCPRCNSIVKIPVQLPSSEASTVRSRPSDGLIPVPKNGLTPIRSKSSPPGGHPGLTPLDSPGLTPIASSSSPVVGLTPILDPDSSDLSGLTPIQTPVSAPIPDAFASAGSSPTNPFGAAGSAVQNPYSSPGFSLPSRPKRRSVDDSKRRGLPWDLHDEDNAFVRTIGSLLNTMGTAFDQMKCGGGFLAPLGFLLLSHLLCVGVVFLFGLVTFGIIAATGQELPIVFRNLSSLNVRALLFALLFFVLEIVTMLGFTAVFSFFVAAMMHAILSVLRESSRGFEATYRVYCYSLGSALPLALVPLVGIVAYLVVYLTLNVRGLIRCQDASSGAAVAAVLLTYVVLSGLAIGVVALAISMT